MADNADPRLRSHDEVAHDVMDVVDLLNDAVLLMDSDWRITYANPAARSISRIENHHLNSHTMWELFPTVIGSELEHAYRETARLQKEHFVNGFFYEPYVAWFDIRVLPIRNGVAIHYRDVTSIKEAEAAGEVVARQLQQVLDATTDGVLSVRKDWRITFLNSRAQQMLAPAGSVLGGNLWKCLPGSSYAGSPYIAHLYRAMNQRIGVEFEAYYPAPLSMWLHIAVQPSEDGIILFFRDVTLRKLQEDALRTSEERYRILTELNPQSLWTADNRGNLIYANDAFLDYIGKDLVPVDAIECLDCFFGADRRRVSILWSRSVSTGENYEMDARVIRARDGAPRWWHLHALPIRDEAGGIQQWLGMANDVHEHHVVAKHTR
jgi:PAS domain S-box-containing protein